LEKAAAAKSRSLPAFEVATRTRMAGEAKRRFYFTVVRYLEALREVSRRSHLLLTAAGAFIETWGGATRQ
jgi:hypothetical protein